MLMLLFMLYCCTGINNDEQYGTSIYEHFNSLYVLIRFEQNIPNAQKKKSHLLTIHPC